MSGRSTSRSHKGISLSRKSEEKAVKHSLERSNIRLLKQKREEQEGGRKENKAREFVRLGNKIIITLRE